MFKSRLYLRVFTNFALLLIVMTVLGLLTVYVISQIEKSNELALYNLRYLNQIRELDQLFSDVELASKNYFVTKTDLSKSKYLQTCQTIDTKFQSLNNSLTDSTVLFTLSIVKEKFYSWVSRIGDKKIELAQMDNTSKEYSTTFQNILTEEADAQYLELTKLYLAEIWNYYSHQHIKSIENTASITREIGKFIIFVNVLVAVFAIALGFFFTRSITTPISLLKEETRNIMEGKFTTIEVNRTDELGQLADDFNRMSVMLGNNYSRLKANSELVTALNSNIDIESVQNVSLELICQYSESSIGALYLYDETNNFLNIVAGYSIKPNGYILRRYKLGEGIPGQCAKLMKPIELAEIPNSTDFVIDTGLVRVIPQFIYSCPVLFKDLLIGVLTLGSTKEYTPLKKEIILNSVSQLGVAITNSKNFEATQELSRTIAKKNDELNDKNTELEKAYRVKSDFLSSMSHELRTPLNSIIGFSSILLGPHGDPLSDDQRMAIEKVLKNGKHLLQLINDILDLSKLEAGRMTVNVETDEVANVVSNSVFTAESLITQKKLTLTQEIEQDLPILKTDILKIKQILVNLLSNAAKFTDRGEIKIMAKRKDSTLSIAVKDSGIGIEEKNLGIVFEEFRQIDSGDQKKYKGTGLGLPISRRLARILGGDLTVESVYGKGSTFILTVPFIYEKEPGKEVVAPKPKLVEEVKSAILPSQISDLKGKPILCIDDDPEAIDILKKYLVPEGFAVSVAYSGDDGLKLAQSTKPALITLDIMMPEKDGWQVLRELKQNPETRDIPVLIHSIIENRPLAMSLGAIDVLPKPLDANIFLNLVHQICTSRDQYILLVDDNIDFLTAMKHLLIVEGFKAETASSGEEALEKIKAQIPALVFIDLIMPGMDGFELVERISKNPSWEKIPIAILSGKELTNEDRQRLDRHIRNFLNKKDLSQTELVKTIKNLLINQHKT